MQRSIRAPRGVRRLTCRNWQIEAAYRMLQNNLDPDVAFDPDHLIVYGGRGRAARNWDCFDAILASLERLQPDETLLVQSGKPVGVLRTHEDAPRVLLANSNIVPAWATQENFDRWEAGRADHVRPDDRRQLDLHRHPGHPAGHLRDAWLTGAPGTAGRACSGKLVVRQGWAKWAARSRWPSR